MTNVAGRNRGKDLRLCLDFANTLSRRHTASPVESLHGYADLVNWGRRVVPDVVAQQLHEEAGRQPSKAAATFRRTLALRETIYRICSAMAAGRAPKSTDLAALNAALGKVLARLRIVAAADGFRWEWGSDARALDRMLWPIVRSASDLLTSTERTHVRECAADSCSWLFMDTSKNQSRRWCDMRVCGNRAKARRHYQRRKASPGRPAA